MIFLLKILKKILTIIYGIIKLIPVKNKITIVSRQSNSPSKDIEMLKMELKNQKPNAEIVVLCKSTRGGLIEKIRYGFHIARQMYHVGTSKTVVLDSYCISVSMLRQRRELKVVQIWHALGALKKFGKSIVGNEGEGRDERLADIMSMHKNYTEIIVSSQNCKKEYSEAFGYDNSYIRVASLPRVDLILNNRFKEETETQVYSRYPSLRYKKTIVYAPTFRINKDMAKEVEELIREVDKEKYTLVIKKHPLMKLDKYDYEGVLWEDEFSTMEMMLVSDYIVADYSAIIFEGALMGKPMFFYVPDFEEYQGRRSFYIDYLNEMPGLVSEDARDIVKAIERDQFNEIEIKKFVDRYIDKQKNCTEDLARIILN